LEASQPGPTKGAGEVAPLSEGEAGDECLRQPAHDPFSTFDGEAIEIVLGRAQRGI
jgi:hypothetical protein